MVVNTGECQAARALEQGVLCANFWAPGTASIITTDSNSASVAVSEGAEELTVAIADPTQVATTFTTTVAVTVDSVISADPGLSVTSMDPLTIDVDLTGAAGATRTLRAKYQPATADAWRSLLAEQHTAGEVDAAARDRLDEEAHALNTRRQVNSLRRTLLEHRDAGVTPAAAAKLDDMAQRLAAQAD
ncbi:MAG: polysaccharide lyase beta-sandwich domain-containing protein [Gammaproteobacteria bacterium]